MQNKDDVSDDYAFAMQLQQKYNNEYNGSIINIFNFCLLGKILNIFN